MSIQPDVIGLIYKPTGKTLTDEEGNEYSEMQAIPGYHVNTPQAVPEWDQYLCDPQPTTPHRVYAGGIMPVCYMFPDQETCDNAISELTGGADDAPGAL